MFQLKLKGDTSTINQNYVHVMTGTRVRLLDDEESIKYVLDNYEPEQVMVEIKSKWYPIHNFYYKPMQDVWLVEGLEND